MAKITLDVFLDLADRIKNMPLHIINNIKKVTASVALCITSDWAITIPTIKDRAINKVGLKLTIFLISINNNIKNFIRNVNEYVANVR